MAQKNAEITSHFTRSFQKCKHAAHECRTTQNASSNSPWDHGGDLCINPHPPAVPVSWSDEWAGSCDCGSGLQRDIHIDASGKYIGQDCEACRVTPRIRPPEEFERSFNDEEEPPISLDPLET